MVLSTLKPQGGSQRERPRQLTEFLEAPGVAENPFARFHPVFVAGLLLKQWDVSDAWPPVVVHYLLTLNSQMLPT